MDWLAFFGLGALRTQRWRRRIALALEILALLVGAGGVVALVAALQGCALGPASPDTGAPIRFTASPDASPLELGPHVYYACGVAHACGHQCERAAGETEWRRCKCGDRKRP